MSSYVLKITGKRLDTFINLLIKLHINFLKVKQTKDYLLIEILEEDYLELTKIKTTYDIEIIKRKGLIYFTHFFKVRKLFILITIMGFILLTLLTNIVFEINVVETDEEIKKIILNDLKSLGLKKYAFKMSYKKKEKLEKEILKKERDILEWIEIEEKGTTYEVKLIRRVKEDIIKDDEPRNIVAKKSGMITRILAEQGEVVTKKNAYVKEGDILISGLIKNKENITDKTRAIGEVYAEVWYKVSLSLPIKYQEQKKTGKNKKVIEIDFLSNYLHLFEFNGYKHYTSSKTSIFKHPLLPLAINFTKKEEVDLINIDYSNNYLEKATDLAIEKLKTKLGKDINIIKEKVLKKEVNADKINIDIFFKVEENITSYVSLKDFNIQEENAKAEEKE